MGCGDVGRVLGNVTDATGLTNFSGDRASQAQAEAARNSNDTQLNMYNQQRADQTPWREAGITALTSLQNKDFMNGWQQDPGYQFRMMEGEKAINSAASARGMANSGATMKALTRYGQDYSSNEYNNVYNREYGRLSSLAGLGSNATNQLVGASQNYGNNVSNNQIGLGNAYASNDIAATNRMGSFINSGAKAAGQAGSFSALFSDERLKEDIKEISPSEMAEMKKNLKAYSFKYKSPEHGEGEYVGVMAQDLEKSRLGRTLVFENEDGEKMIDINRVLMMFLATLAEG